jgi:hypothetical protein
MQWGDVAVTMTAKKGRRSSKLARGAPRTDTPTAPAPTGALVGAEGLPISDYAGWDPERGGWVHGDPGKQALDLVNEAAAKRR